MLCIAEDEEPAAEVGFSAAAAAAKDALEPQASTKAHETRQRIAARGGELPQQVLSFNHARASPQLPIKLQLHA